MITQTSQWVIQISEISEWHVCYTFANEGITHLSRSWHKFKDAFIENAVTKIFFSFEKTRGVQPNDLADYLKEIAEKNRS